MEENRANEINAPLATLKMNLKADNGYGSKFECRINYWQWRAIDLIIESKEFTEQRVTELEEMLERKA